MSPSGFPQAPDVEPRSGAGLRNAILLLALIAVAVGGYVTNRTLGHIERLNANIDSLQDTLRRTADDADAATQRAAEAEQLARTADTSRAQAEETAEQFRQHADDAGQRATAADQRAADAERQSRVAQEEARLVREQAEEIERAADAEMNRLTEALGRIAETRRTALGLVMSLDEGYLKFDFDEAELKADSREVLSRIAGILLTAGEFAITVSGHTDARGSEEYNLELSERRAQAVADYLVEAGLSRDLFTVKGLGKSQLLATGEGAEAHSKNRRVELGMVNARVVEVSELESFR